jgi:hypothetical protein
MYVNFHLCVEVNLPCLFLRQLHEILRAHDGQMNTNMNVSIKLLIIECTHAVMHAQVLQHVDSLVLECVRTQKSLPLVCTCLRICACACVHVYPVFKSSFHLTCFANLFIQKIIFESYVVLCFVIHTYSDICYHYGRLVLIRHPHCVQSSPLHVLSSLFILFDPKATQAYRSLTFQDAGVLRKK